MKTDRILENLKIKSLNPMQLAAIEAISENPKLILLSDTGSGKTLGFLDPLIQSIDTQHLNRTQALIMVPSRELALQIESVLKQIQPGCKITACYGGHKREIEENNLIEAPAIIIATAGRMADHLRRGNIKPEHISFLVMDEFDKMLELGFIEEMEFIIKNLTGVNKTMLTSATQAIDIPEFVNMSDALTLNFLSNEPKNAIILSIKHINTPENDKIDTLFGLICAVKDTSSIVFCNHRDAVERTYNLLTDKGILCVFYHGGMEQHDREVALCKFRNGTSNILITTDLASRGLDVANVRNVIHYHLPNTEDAFTHRNGRTARMDATGSVFLLIGPQEELPDYIRDVSTIIDLPSQLEIPEKPKWSTLFIAAGKKDKINKIDIVGFLTNKGNLKKDEIGLIEVKDFSSFVAVRKSKIGQVIESVKNEKIKNKKVKIAIAR
jgi:ATP-independent RNA helicase DbpA